MRGWPAQEAVYYSDVELKYQFFIETHMVGKPSGEYMTTAKGCVAILLWLTAVQTHAIESTVVESMQTCRHIVLESELGFLPIRLQEGSSIPQTGRTLGGSIDGSRGLLRLRVLSTSEVLWAYNDTGWMTKSEAFREFIARCS